MANVSVSVGRAGGGVLGGGARVVRLGSSVADGQRECQCGARGRGVGWGCACGWVWCGCVCAVGVGVVWLVLAGWLLRIEEGKGRAFRMRECNFCVVSAPRWFYIWQFFSLEVRPSRGPVMLQPGVAPPLGFF
jgi:hypothetical protein